MISEADTDEEDGQGGEAHELDGLPTDGVDGGDGDPIAGDGTGADQDQVADGVLAEDLEHVVTTAETDVGQDDGVVQTESVKGHVQKEPGSGGAEEDLAVTPLGVMMEEVGPTGLGRIEFGAGLVEGGDALNLIGSTLGMTLEVGLDVLAGLLDVPGDVKGISGRLRDGQAIVKGDTAGHGAEADNDAPHLVDGLAADAAAVGGILAGLERFLEAGGDDEGNQGGDELTDALHGEDGAHHGSSPFGGGEPTRKRFEGKIELVLGSSSLGSRGRGGGGGGEGRRRRRTTTTYSDVMMDESG